MIKKLLELKNFTLRCKFYKLIINKYKQQGRELNVIKQELINYIKTEPNQAYNIFIRLKNEEEDLFYKILNCKEFILPYKILNIISLFDLENYIKVRKEIFTKQEIGKLINCFYTQEKTFVPFYLYFLLEILGKDYEELIIEVATEYVLNKQYKVYEAVDAEYYLKLITFTKCYNKKTINALLNTKNKLQIKQCYEVLKRLNKSSNNEEFNSLLNLIENVNNNKLNKNKQDLKKEDKQASYL